MKKLEADITPKVMKWARVVLPSSALEIKHTRGKNTFSMRELHEHQVYALLACKSTIGYAYKISDMSAGQKPFDGFLLKSTHAYVCIMYPEFLAVVDIDALCQHSGPSLTSEDAKKIAEHVVPKSQL